jgi:hypothetical protein
MPSPLNSNAIAERVPTARTVEHCDDLVREIAARREHIRQRLLQIDEAPGEPTPERRAAVQAGLDAVLALDGECNKLRRELQVLDALEGRVYERRHELEVEALKREIPAALRELPKASATVREALAALDAAIAAHRRVVETIAEFEKAGRVFPLNDKELADLYQLRHAVWAQRNVAALFPPSYDEAWEVYPRSWALFYRFSNGVYSEQRPVPFKPVYQDAVAEMSRTTGRRGANGDRVVAVGNVGRMG